ncbi:hypothetical protein [Burkholderia arboris]|uniref:hypothetical protein n=1 Tax=Burkholderia arboris TaxID=488730 RepID=UPI00158E8D55|nr:hypothetical protein [Burkholderia arboris]
MSLELALPAIDPRSRATPVIHDGAELTASIYAAHTVQRMIRAITAHSVAVPQKTSVNQ